MCSTLDLHDNAFVGAIPFGLTGIMPAALNPNCLADTTYMRQAWCQVSGTDPAEIAALVDLYPAWSYFTDPCLTAKDFFGCTTNTDSLNHILYVSRATVCVCIRVCVCGQSGREAWCWCPVFALYTCRLCVFVRTAACMFRV